MTAPEFVPYGKTPRLFRDMIVTEKIDGTNAGIRIADDGSIYAQSRNRLITPGKHTDNAGFAAWVAEHAGTLVDDLGPGLHFGEWYGQGIQRGYGLTEKRFALFNPHRYPYDDFYTPQLECVPVLAETVFSTNVIDACLDGLEADGSEAVPGYMRPEGVIVWHDASRQRFKALIEHDDTPKSVALGAAA